MFKHRVLAIVLNAGLACSLASAQQAQEAQPAPSAPQAQSAQSPQPAPPAQPSQPMQTPPPAAEVPEASPTDASNMREMPGMGGDGSAHAMHSMEGHHMDMGPHMKMTTLRDSKPGDDERAQQVVEAARKAAEKYTDYKAALADGYKIFLPNLPQKQYHFTNYWYAFEAARNFNPEHPTSLLYEKQGDGYRLIGVMYTAPKTASEAQLDQRIPLSVAQWHAHVNMCMPPEDRKSEMWGARAKFGLAGSISTRSECDAEGGKFMPQIFGWMVHVYPFEKTSAEIWSVEPQARAHTD